MIKKQIVIDIQFGSEWQEELHMNTIKMLFGVMSTNLNIGIGEQSACHKDNKFEFKVIDK